MSPRWPVGKVGAVCRGTDLLRGLLLQRAPVERGLQRPLERYAHCPHLECPGALNRSLPSSRCRLARVSVRPFESVGPLTVRRRSAGGLFPIDPLRDPLTPPSAQPGPHRSETARRRSQGTRSLWDPPQGTLCWSRARRGGPKGRSKGSLQRSLPKGRSKGPLQRVNSKGPKPRSKSPPSQGMLLSKGCGRQWRRWRGPSLKRLDKVRAETMFTTPSKSPLQLGPRVERRRVRGRGARALAQIEFEAWRIAGASRSARPPLGRRSLLLRLRLGDADFRLAFHLVVRRAPSRAALGFGQRRRRRRRSSGGAGAFDNVGRDGQRTHKRRPRALPKGRPSAD
ncbi:hypothetical protein M885DRAFT_141478 [Pelagophyceae sp. CCMP2097]|nr:hypothetical protein M885DRAFT_141478 [Pelagophyceae sp. CCMP2097]